MRTMGHKLMMGLCACVALFAVCSPIRQAAASAPYEGDSSNAALDGIRGVNTASGGLGVRGQSDTPSVTGAAVRGEALYGGWGGWFSSTGTALVCGGGSTGIDSSGSGYGVFGHSSIGMGVWGKGEGTAGGNYGVYGSTTSASSAGGYFIGATNGVSLKALAPAGGSALRTDATAPDLAADFHGKVAFSGSWYQVGTGSPNGSVVGAPGDVYLNRSGGAGTTLYIKESGLSTNTGWVAK